MIGREVTCRSCGSPGGVWDKEIVEAYGALAICPGCTQTIFRLVVGDITVKAIPGKEKGMVTVQVIKETGP